MDNPTQKTNNFNPNYISFPGETLLEMLEMHNMTQVELSQRIDRPEKTISEIVNGVTSITPETAIQLEKVFNLPASFWNNLEKNYQEKKARLKFVASLGNETKFINKYPYATMVKYGWVKKATSTKDKIENLLKFFGVTSLSLVPKVMDINYRQHKGKNISYEAIAAWVRKGEIDSQTIETNPFNEKRLRESLIDFKNLTTLDPQEFVPILQKRLAECGVALVFTPNLPRTYVCGATRWPNQNRALLQLSLRGNYADIMWFTLFHELGHILLHGKREKFIDMDTARVENSQLELQADKFSANQLLPEGLFQQFIDSNELTKTNIMAFAKELNLHPGIIVGRLLHLGKVTYKEGAPFRDRYKWKEN